MDRLTELIDTTEKKETLAFHLCRRGAVYRKVRPRKRELTRKGKKTNSSRVLLVPPRTQPLFPRKKREKRLGTRLPLALVTTDCGRVIMQPIRYIRVLGNV